MQFNLFFLFFSLVLLKMFLFYRKPGVQRGYLRYSLF